MAAAGPPLLGALEGADPGREDSGEFPRKLLPVGVPKCTGVPQMGVPVSLRELTRRLPAPALQLHKQREIQIQHDRYRQQVASAQLTPHIIYKEYCKTSCLLHLQLAPGIAASDCAIPALFSAVNRSHLVQCCHHLLKGGPSSTVFLPTGLHKRNVPAVTATEVSSVVLWRYCNQKHHLGSLHTSEHRVNMKLLSLPLTCATASPATQATVPQVESLALPVALC